MNTTTVQSALEVLENPAVIHQHVTGNPIPTDTTIPSFNIDDQAVSADLLVALADGLGASDETFNKAYHAVKEKNDVTTRGVTEVIDYAGKAYNFISEHWDTIFFLLMYVNKAGYLDKIKQHPRLKTFFKTLFEED